MKAPEDVLVLTELLDKQVHHALSQKGTRLLLAIPPLLDFISGEPRLAGLVQDLLRETDERWSAYERVCIDVQSELCEMWPACHDALLPKRQADEKDMCHWEDEGFDCFEDRLKEELRVDRGYTREPPEAINKRLFWATHWVQCGFDHEAKRFSDPVLADSAIKLREMREALEQAWVRLRLHLDSGGGVAFAELRDVAARLVPGLTTGDDDYLVAVRNENARKVWEEIDKQALFQDQVEGDISVWLHSQFVRQLHLALQTGLARGRSRAAIVRRYAARCETFDREQLLAKVKRAKGRVEDELTLDFARYLFDIGFNPIVSPEVASLRPDLLDVNLQTAVYVEAKQYAKPERAKLAKSVAQVFDTWGRLANRYNVAEAFLLVFRIGGRPLQLPDSVPANGRKLNLQVVDLAPAAETGSRAKKPPLVLTESDLLPEAKD